MRMGELLRRLLARLSVIPVVDPAWSIGCAIGTLSAYARMYQNGYVAHAT